MHLKDRFSPNDVRLIYADLTIKSTCSQQCRIQNVRSVGRSQNNNSGICPKSVHFYQERVKGVFPFVVRARHLPFSSGSSNRIYFINKDDTRCLFFGLLKKVSYTRSTDPYKHLHKVRT